MANSNAHTIGKLDGVAGSSVTVGSATLTAGGGDATGGDFASVISGAGGFTKTGTGTQRLGGLSAHNYSGATLLSGGTLIISGSINGTSGLIVQTGAILAGAGTITPVTGGTGNIVVQGGGQVAPGNGTIGTLHASLDGGAKFDISLGVAAATPTLLFDLDAIGASDGIQITGGALEIGSGLLGINDFAFNLMPGIQTGTYTLFDGNTAISGSLDLANLSGDLGGGYFGTLDASADGGNDLVLMVVPEPSAAVSLLAGTGVLLGLHRRRRA